MLFHDRGKGKDGFSALWKSRLIALRARTEAIARHLSDFLKRTDRFAKTIVFCVSQEHADEMRRALGNLNADLVAVYPDYVSRVTSEEGNIGRAHLGRFVEPESLTPVILTTSQLLTTGVDAPTCKNIALARLVGSMTEFKQIIGRGTRVRDDYGKYFFSILDYTGSATQHFADPDFDGDPILILEQDINDRGEIMGEHVIQPEQTESYENTITPSSSLTADLNPEVPLIHRKYYVDGGQVAIAADLVYCFLPISVS